jgi:hypothetical protein
LASLGFRKNELTPTDESVAEIFLAIIPLLPTPAQIVLPLQFPIRSTAFSE